MADENNPPKPSPENQDGKGAVDQKGLHVVLKEVVGKEYANEDAAKEAIKETFSYVGDIGGLVKEVMNEKGLNRTQAVDFIKGQLSQKPQSVDTSKFVSKEEFAEAQFFADNPQFKDYKDILQTFKKANPGKSLEEITKEASFKQWMDSDLETKKKQKSILHSNPKIQVAEDKMAKAREGVKKGNVREAQDQAVGAVMDAFGMKGE